MVTLGKRLIYCLAFFMFTIGFLEDAQAARFGLNTGLYKEGIRTSCAHTGEVGLRLGLYFDRTVNDIMYMAAKNGTSLCDIGCGCGSLEQIQVAAPVGCSAPVQPICRNCQTIPQVAAPPIASQVAPSNKTEIYLLVLPETKTQQPPQQVVYYQAPPQAQPYYAPIQQPQYYREPVEYGSQQGRPIRGMW